MFIWKHFWTGQSLCWWPVNPGTNGTSTNIRSPRKTPPWRANVELKVHWAPHFFYADMDFSFFCDGCGVFLIIRQHFFVRQLVSFIFLILCFTTCVPLNTVNSSRNQAAQRILRKECKPNKFLSLFLLILCFIFLLWWQCPSTPLPPPKTTKTFGGDLERKEAS